MASGAQVNSVDALRAFRVALIKFIEHGNVALMAGDADVDRTLGWLEREQSVYWANQLRKRHDHVQACAQTLRDKQLFKSFDGTTPSVVDEMKALALAKRRRDEAEQKILAVKKSISVLRRESLLYKGRMQRLASTLQGDLPRAVHALSRMLTRLDEYLAVHTTGSGIDWTDAIEQFARAAGPLQGNARVRSLMPTVAQRQAALPAAEVTAQPWVAGALPDWQHPLSAQLMQSDPAPAIEHRVTIAIDPSPLSRWALERAEPAFEGDTGWCLFPAEASVDGDRDTSQSDPAPQTWAVWQVLQAAPDLKPLLSLPVGYLVIVDSTGIVTVLDGDDTDQWAAALSRSAGAGAT